MTSSKTTEPTIIIQSEDLPEPASGDFIGRQKEFADTLLDMFVRQLRLMHAMMVELPFAWAAARDEAPPPLAMDQPAPAIAANVAAEELLPATRKRKKSAPGEAKVRKAAAKPACNTSSSNTTASNTLASGTSTGKKTSRKDSSTPPRLH
jgi:hypothetical protein